MSHLLISETFDNYQFIEGEIVTFNTFTMDGYVQKDFYETDEPLPLYSAWKNVKNYCLSLIKGKRTPLSFKFIFCLSAAQTVALIQEYQLAFSPDDIQGLYLNLRYDGTALQCVTGTSTKAFSLDKSLEQAWDKYAVNFFKTHEISFDYAT